MVGHWPLPFSSEKNSNHKILHGNGITTSKPKKCKFPFRMQLKNCSAVGLKDIFQTWRPFWCGLGQTLDPVQDKQASASDILKARDDQPLSLISWRRTVGSEHQIQGCYPGTLGDQLPKAPRQTQQSGVYLAAFTTESDLSLVGSENQSHRVPELPVWLQGCSACRGKERGLWSHSTSVCIRALLFTSCKLLNFPVPLFPHLKNYDNNS